DLGDFRRASAAVWSIAVAANRYISQSKPWLLARDAGQDGGQASRQLDEVLALLGRACQELADQLGPFLPDASDRLAGQLTPVGRRLPAPDPVFARIEADRLAV